MGTYLENAEEAELFRQKQKDNSGMVFLSSGSAGRNPLRLAQVLTAFDLAISLLGWQDKPLANLTKFLTSYQASVDGAYHKDFKDIEISEMVERKQANRKGLSIFQQ